MTRRTLVNSRDEVIDSVGYCGTGIIILFKSGKYTYITSNVASALVTDDTQGVLPEHAISALFVMGSEACARERRRALYDELKKEFRDEIRPA